MGKLILVVPESKHEVGYIDSDVYDDADGDDLEYEYDIQISNALTSLETYFEYEDDEETE